MVVPISRGGVPMLFLVCLGVLTFPLSAIAEPPPAGAALLVPAGYTQEVTARYVGGAERAIVCQDGDRPGIGGICAGIEDTQGTQTTITITDDSGDPVGGVWWVHVIVGITDPQQPDRGTFCGTTVPTTYFGGGLARYFVALAPSMATECGGAPTSGEISVIVE